MRKRTLFLFCILFLLASPLAQAAPGPWGDYQDHWARMYITQVLEAEILTTDAQGNIQPDAPINRGDLAGAIARVLQVAPANTSSFTDTKEHQAHYLIGGLVQEELLSADEPQFRPFDPVTRKEAVTMINECFRLGLAEETDTAQDIPLFIDLKPEDPVYRQARIADVLGYLPPTFVGRFAPDQVLTRAEAAAMLSGIMHLRPIYGEIIAMDQDQGLMTVLTRQNEEIQVQLSPKTVIYRNNVQTDVQNLRNQDKIYIIEDLFGQTKVIKAFGIITPQDLLSRVSGMTRGVLTPTQLNELVQGNWDKALTGMASNLSQNLFNELAGLGFSDEEVQHLRNQDWESLEQAARTEIYTHLGEQLELPEEMVKAAVNQDWEAVGDFAKLHLATALLSRLGVI